MSWNVCFFLTNTQNPQRFIHNDNEQLNLFNIFVQLEKSDLNNKSIIKTVKASRLSL